MSQEALNRWITYTLSRPLNHIFNIVKSSQTRLQNLNNKQLSKSQIDSVFKFTEGDDPKFMMYSAHDSTLVPLWNFVEMFNYTYDEVGYAANWQLILKYDAECIQGLKDLKVGYTDCFKLQTFNNGVEMFYNSIKDNSYNTVVEHFQDISYNDQGYDLDVVKDNCWKD